MFELLALAASSWQSAALYYASLQGKVRVRMDRPQHEAGQAPRVHHTLCRICEAYCGLEVTTEGAKVVSVKPDKQHPFSQGYACIKGSSLGQLHHDPARLNHPMKKVAGQWQRISWEQAIAEIGRQVRGLRKTHGNRCIAHYTGNPTYFSAQNTLYADAFLKALGSPNLYASHSIDVNNKFHVSTEMLGNSLLQPIPDFDHCSFFLCMGSNPQASQMSVVSQPHAMRALKGIQTRGGRVVIVDPRRTETAEKLGDHVFIKPGTDVYLLLGLLHVLVSEAYLPPEATVERLSHVADDIAGFLAVAKDWTPPRVAAITGIEAEVIRQLAREYANAQGAVLYLSTGVNMGPFGSLAYWLLLGLSVLTDNLDRQGGLLFGQGPFDVVKVTRALGLNGFDQERTLARGLHRVAGAFPVAALEEEIRLDHPQRIRALFISAGNPLHSVPGNDLKQALTPLDLKVAIDIYMSESAMVCDYALPATDMLERGDYPLSHASLQPRPHASYAHQVLPAKFERRQEWQIFSDLAQACGAPLIGSSLLNVAPRLNRVLGKLPLPKSVRGGLKPDHLLALLLASGRKVSLRQLKAQARGVALPPNQPDRMLGRALPTANGRVQLMPERLVADLPRLEQLADGFLDQPSGLRVIGRRERRSHNSWMHNNPAIKQDSGNQALMHPSDAAERGLSDGDTLRIGDKARAIELPVKLTDTVMPGVLVVPHGWGHKAAGQGKARTLPGDNINTVLPNVAQHIDPVSGQAIMLGHVVEVCAARS